MANITLYRRSFRELKDNTSLGFDDPNNIVDALNPAMREALLAKPAGYQPDETCQIIALDENKVIGTIITFSNILITNNIERLVQNASSLYVHPDYRKAGIGRRLMTEATQLGLMDRLSGGISQMAFPIYMTMGYTCFQYPRFICLKKSRAVVQHIFHSERSWTKPIIWCIDILLAIHNKIVFAGCKNKKWQVEKCTEVPMDVEQIIRESPHKYKELHNKAWFEWNLNYSFNQNDTNKKELFVIKDSQGKILAFFLNKIQFHKQASSRGFKNVLLGSVMEWGIAEGVGMSETELQLIAINHMPNNIDGAQITSDNKSVVKAFRKRLFLNIGYVNMVARIKSFQDESINDLKNWRFRMAVSDTLIG